MTNSESWVLADGSVLAPQGHLLRSGGAPTGETEFEEYRTHLNHRSRARRPNVKVHRIEKFWAWLEASDILPQNLKADIFERYIRALKSGELCKKVERYSPRTITYFRRAALEWTRYLYKSGKLLLDPFEEFTAEDSKRCFKLTAMTEEQVQRILRAPNLETPLGLRNKAILELAYGSGLRLQELTDLTLSSFDLKERSVDIRNTKNNWDRRVPLTQSATVALEEYLKRGRPTLLGPDCGQHLWLNRHRKPFRYSGMIALPRAYTSELGFHFSMHDFRHAFTTHLLSGGAQSVHLAQLLGHRDLDSTSHYARVKFSELQEVHSKVHPRD